MSIIELIRKAQGERSQNEFALHAGVSSAALTRIYQGERKPSPDTLRKIANRAHNGVTYEQLMEACGYIEGDSEPIKGMYARMARDFQELGASESDIDFLKAVYKEHKRANEPDEKR